MDAGLKRVSPLSAFQITETKEGGMMVITTTQKEYTGSIAKVGRQEEGCPIDCRLKTRDGHYQRPSEQYAQPLLESKIYVARRTRIEAPARSTILRRVGLLEALSSAARSP